MKRTVIALACVCFASIASAQVSDFAPSSPSTTLPQTEITYPVITEDAVIVSPVINQTTQTRVPLAPGLRMKKAGQTMTIIGGILFVGGIVMVAQADDDYYTSTTTTQYGTTTENGDPKFALGVVMITHGVGLTIPGIILWTRGNKKFNRWTEEQRQQNLSMGLNRSGVGMRYRF
ncbi:hypothetical protein [Pseudochryseolinea flava]|uniref:Uncharacterized protein n=1 Tax=Pseudochryseolinea flava TaxID=2059302 RepID=A0A364Y7K6_9BACT|nr:hypothetical protein [Pseudochryseolinea flava]RAW01804.1 hypothetical protein DQQ10_09165 [Pseudochryseolinea flava]